MNKTLVIIGIIILIIGILWPVLSKLPIGKLPGDIVIKRDGFSFYLPITTMIIVSVLLSILFWFFKK